jgi:hypothetical protein
VFDPIRSYDKPEVILTQLANGIATTDSVRRVLFDPAALSPRERTMFVDRMKDEVGRNPVTDVALDLLTNPFVWLGVLASAGGSPAVRNIARGGRFFGATSGAGAYVANKFPLLRNLHLTSGQTESIGRRAAPLAQWAVQGMEDTRRRLGGVMDAEAERLLAAVSRKHGVQVTRFEPENAPTPAVAEDLRKIRGWLHVKGLGLDQDRTERVVRGVGVARYSVRVGRSEGGKMKVRTMGVDADTFDELQGIFEGRGKMKVQQVLDPTNAVHRELLERMPGLSKGETLLESMNARGLDRVTFRPGMKGGSRRGATRGKSSGMDFASVTEGGPTVLTEEVRRRALVQDKAALDAVEREFGLGAFKAAEDRMYELGKVLMAGDEAAYAAGRGFVVDEAKLKRLARGQVQSLRDAGYLSESGEILGGAQEQVRQLLSDETAGRLIREAEKTTGRKLKRGATVADIERVVVEAMKESYSDPFYRPRNTVQAYDVNGKRIDFNPWTGKGVDEKGGEVGSVSGRTQFRTRTSAIPWDPRDLEFIRDKFGGTGAMDRLIGKQQQRIQGQKDKENFYRVLRIAPDIAASKYVASTARDYTVFSRDVANDPTIRSIVKDLYPGRDTKARYAGPLGAMREGGASVGERNLLDVPEAQRPMGGYNWFDLMEGDLQAQATARPEDRFAIDLWRKEILPATMGIKPVESAAHVATAKMMREATRRLADSRLMRAVERGGGYSAQFVQQMRAWGNDEEGDRVSPWQSVTRLLYGSHMGLNMGTVLINLLQPLQSIHQLGFRNTVEAYRQSFEQIGGYLKARKALGPGATNAQIADVMRSSFSRRFGGQALDISQVAELGNAWSSVEAAGYGSTPLVGKPQFSLLETMMKPFQLSETLNRTVTANAVLNAYQRAGRMGADDFVRAQQDAMAAVQQFQFGTSPINRPAMFYLPVLRNPAFRQFAQYGIRSMANLFTVPEQIGGDRMFAGQQVTGRLGRTLVDLSRMMAVSAVTYEIGKSALGVDLSRGLAGGFTDILPDPNKDEPNFYTPPVVDLGWQAARYLATGDAEILQDFVPRVLPGGVAISRAIGVAPSSRVMQAVGLQRTYADWRQAEAGNVPVFNADGRFMGQFPTSDVVLKAFGTDLGRFGNPQELSQFLLKNRDAIRDGRRQYIAAILANNMSQAKRVKVQFEKRFGLPLTVTQDQMKQAIKLREESVVSRTVETIDKTARDVYREAVEQELPGQLMRAEVPGGPVEQGDMYRWGAR